MWSKEFFDCARDILKNSQLDAFYFPSFDVYLNEYTEKHECHRYLVSNFSGSTGEALLRGDRVRVYIDGRYHEQADNECDPSFVDVIKTTFEKPNLKALQEDLKELNVGTLGVESGRLSLSLFQSLQKHCEIKTFESNIFQDKIPKVSTLGRVNFIDKKFSGEDFKEKIHRILQGHQAIFLCKLDSLCWPLNLRGFQMPYHSVVKAKALISSKRVVLFVPEDSKIDPAVLQHFHIMRCCEEDYVHELARELRASDATEILFNPQEVSALDARLLQKNFRGKVVESQNLINFQSVKNPVEITSFEHSFDKADKAIFKTLSWLKREAVEGKISERDFRDKTEENYRLIGAKCQSFPTIAGFGKNASIIHYSDPKSDCFLNSGETALLDSGGIFEEGLATDCTRTVLGYGKASKTNKLIYTLVLIGFLRVHHASFKRGTPGKELDAIARAAMKLHGFDYAHGTGHGVGINVHEGGFNLSPISDISLEKGKVGSIEPGIYLPDVGGVRIENVAVVEDNPMKRGYLHFRPLVFLGFDHELIDLNLLTNEEKGWLFNYERECAKRGRSFCYA